MSQPESGYRQNAWEKQSGENRAPSHHPQIPKVLIGRGKEEREEVISEERFIGPEIKRPVSIFQKQLLWKREASENMSVQHWGKVQETQVDEGSQVQNNTEWWGLCRTRELCPIWRGQHHQAAWGAPQARMKALSWCVFNFLRDSRKLDYSSKTSIFLNFVSLKKSVWWLNSVHILVLGRWSPRSLLCPKKGARTAGRFARPKGLCWLKWRTQQRLLSTKEQEGPPSPPAVTQHGLSEMMIEWRKWERNAQTIYVKALCHVCGLRTPKIPFGIYLCRKIKQSSFIYIL